MFLLKRIILLLLIIPVSISAFAQDSTAVFPVAGVCGSCKARIEKSVRVKGVYSAKWDAGSQAVTIQFDPAVVSLISLKERIAAVGHDTDEKKAPEAIYKALPDCCLYKDGVEVHSDEEEEPDPNAVAGVVLKEDSKGNFLPLSGANIQWVGGTKVIQSDRHGEFSIPIQAEFNKLTISYAGLNPDTIEVKGPQLLQVVLNPNNELSTIVVTSRKKNIHINHMDPFRIANINSGELLKAACCNLSESFETNPSVDVQYSDAVTGSKQIQLLGLSGIYTQLTVENLPGPRGLSTLLGLNSIAGPWVESIQMSKGTGSVVNGFESIAGQINVELKKPGEVDEVYINGYLNSMGKADFNVNVLKTLNKKWGTALLLHDDFLYNRSDMNADGFRDLPTGNLFSAVNRWHYVDHNFSSEFGFKILKDERVGGELDFEPGEKLTTRNYGIGINTDRYEGFFKAGYLFPEKKYKSIGIQLSAFDHKMDSYFGLLPYTGDQQNLYANLIYQSIIGNTAHKFRTGLSFVSDRYNEKLGGSIFKRNESVPGGFFEYTYGIDKFTLVTGVRADHNNLYGWFITPRINARYAPFEKTVIRISAGRGQRTANVLAENMSNFISSRQVIFENSVNGKAYGLLPEVSWNKGITLDQKIRLFNRDASLTIDYFRNDFQDQVVANLEDINKVKFTNVKGKSFSNSLQAELNLVPVKKLDVRLAYRWFDVQTTYDGQLLQKPFNAKHRAFANVGYELDRWKFDATFNFIGSKRIPAISHAAGHSFPLESPSYNMLNAQVSYVFGRNRLFELYLGGENLTNVLQHESVIGASDPFGPYFDASMVWGPVSGSLIYGGFRYTLK